MAFLFQQKDSSDDSQLIMPPEKHQDLLIFGYHCKLFRDDDRALAIDAGEHLIPWMGDANLKIDRYDGRGHLFDLRQYDADNMEERGEPSAEEIRIERLCEEERYLELHTDLAEKAIEEEEEIKRLNMELAESSGYQAVGFSYDQQPTSKNSHHPTDSNTADSTTREDEEDDDQEFIPPKELSLPPSMIYPTGTKLNALIEKTAKFVSSHGGQMEIMIKTKQANNPQFKFLNFEHHLNPYYKHQVFMIKSGRYNPDVHNKPPPPPPPTKSAESESDEEDSGYLHPSLLAAKTVSSHPTQSSTVPTPQYTQSQLQNTAYGRLLKKISDNLPSTSNSPQRTATPTLSDTDSNSQVAFTDLQLSSTLGADPATHNAAHEYSGGGVVGANGYPYSTDSTAAAAYYNQYYQSYSNIQPYPPPSAAVARPASPPTDIKPIIDRVVDYIKRDGDAFEKQVLRRKHDSRFSFLQPGDDYHDYYIWRKQCILTEKEQMGDNSKGKGVSFSIKQKEPETTSIDTSRVALPIDPESDDEEGPTTTEGRREASSSNNQVYTASVPIPQPNTSRVEDKPPQSNESLQKKIAEQKLRDKLAAAAREKMTQVTQNTKDKSLQAERKRKAAMFVNMLKSKQKGVTGEPTPSAIGPDLPPPDPTRLPLGGSQSPAESRLQFESSSDYSNHDNPHHSHSQTRSRSPPSAYTVRVNRGRNAHSKHSRLHESQSSGGSSSSNSSSRHSRRQTDDRPSHHHHRSKRRSPSPSLSTKSKRSRHRESPSHQLKGIPLHTNTEPDGVRGHHHSTLNPPIPEIYSRETSPPPSSGANENNEFMLKVRRMLKESRQAVYKEDLFGN